MSVPVEVAHLFKLLNGGLAGQIGGFASAGDLPIYPLVTFFRAAIVFAGLSGFPKALSG